MSFSYLPVIVVPMWTTTVTLKAMATLRWIQQHQR